MLLQAGKMFCRKITSVSNAKSKESFFVAGELSACTNSYFSDAASQLIPRAAPGKLMKLESREPQTKKKGGENLTLSVCEPKAGRSQNHRIVGVGRDLCGSSSPTPLPKQGHLQQAAQDLVQAG